MLMTSSAESDGGHWIKQVEGPALSWWMVEPETMYDNYENYLRYRTDLTYEIYHACGELNPNEDALQYNIAFAFYMARLKYWRSPRPIPKTLEGKAIFHEEVYNAGGKADWEDTLAKYKHFVL